MNPPKILKKPLIDEYPSEVFEITNQKLFQSFREEINPALITKKNLTDLFIPDNIRSGVSYKIITSLSGIGSILYQLKTNIDTGITVQNPTELEERKRKYGKNNRAINPLKSLWFFLREFSENLMLRVLIVAAFLTLLIGMIGEGVEKGWIEGTALLLTILIIFAIISFNNYQKEREISKLNGEQSDLTVTRDNEIQQIPFYELLVGDIVHIAAGDIISADGILVEGNKIKMDESLVTGEFDLIVKTDFKTLNEDYTSLRAKKETPFLISGSKVMEGSGKLLACAVGIDSQIGQQKLKLKENDEPTLLQFKLETLAHQIGVIGLSAGMFTICVMAINLFVKMLIGAIIWDSKDIIKEIIGYLLIGVTIFIIALPSGLPLAVNIALTNFVRKMLKDNNLVRHLSNFEIIGAVNNICSNTTGILTRNCIRVKNLYVSRQDHNSSNLTIENIDPFILNILIESACINTYGNPRSAVSESFLENLGSKTESALLELCSEMGIDYKKFIPSQKPVRILPYSSKTKRMTIVYEYTPGKFRIYSKGESEIMLNICKYVLMKENDIFPLCEEEKINIQDNVIEDYARKALSTITFGYREVNNGELDVMNCSEEELESYFTLIAIVGVMDPLRQEINEAFKRCQDAGIFVRMVTEDSITTAVAIAKQSGIFPKDAEDHSVFSNNYYAMEGHKFREFVGGIVYANEEDEKAGKNAKIGNMENFKKVAQNLRVLARSTPEDKYILVLGLKLLNNVVAVTGGANNDALTFKNADVSFAMGIAGTEIARKTSDIILLDDNFASIVAALLWGRNIYDSIRKFLQFQLTMSIVTVFMAFLEHTFTKQSPIKGIQMLWVILIIDAFACLTLATENPNRSILKKSPYKRNESIVTPIMWRNILGQSIFQIIILTILLFFGPNIFGVESSFNMDKIIWNEEKGRNYTILFESFVFLQLFNEINCRKLKRTEYNIFKGFLSNRLFIVIKISIAILLIVIVQFDGDFLKTSPLSWEQHVICIGIGSLSLLNGLFVKLLPETLFKKIKFLEEEETAVAQPDRSLSN